MLTDNTSLTHCVVVKTSFAEGGHSTKCYAHVGGRDRERGWLIRMEKKTRGYNTVFDDLISATESIYYGRLEVLFLRLVRELLQTSFHYKVSLNRIKPRRYQLLPI